MGSRRSRRSHGRVQLAFSPTSKRAVASGKVSKVARFNRAQKKAAILASAKAARKQASSQPPLLLALLSVANVADEQLSRLASVLLATETDKNARRLETFVVRREGFSDREVLIAALDAAKVADVMLLAFGGREERMDEMGVKLVAAMREQGLPTVVAVALGEEGGDVALRKMRGRVLAAESIGEDHALRPIQVLCEEGSEAREINKMALRRISAKTPRCVSWRARYGYMRVEEVNMEKVDGRDSAVFRLCGWVRGRGFSANELIHITGFGSFAVLQVVDAATGNVLSKRNEDEAEPVESEGEVDQLMGEQTWPPEMEEEGDEEERGDELKDLGEKLAEEYDQTVNDLNQVDDYQKDEENNTEMFFMDEREGEQESGDMDDDSMSVDEEEVKKVREAAKADALFPDEVDTPIDQPARIRFARYRGLRSLRTGEWDPKEQLPEEYASLFQFRNLAATRKRVLNNARKEAEESAKGEGTSFASPGQKVYIFLLDVPIEIQRSIATTLYTLCRPVVASGMLRHENRRSVVHFGVQRVDEEGATEVKAKAHLELHCGFVRFEGRPMFSEHNANSSKHKMERFLRHGRYTVASFYGPAIFTPAPALLCYPGGSLIATGTALGADPDRIILKRIILTGYPFKTQKRRTVVKFMFFNPDDVRWFKPVELWTKMGRSGHILEPVGTHGHMKCIFDSAILHHDTICMTLYKRVYPKILA